MITAFIVSAVAVFLAEMGDKTQLLAIAFSTRYRWYVVLGAVAVATAANHFLAVVAGNLATSAVPIGLVKFLAAVSFLVFSIWTLHDDSSPEAGSRSYAGPFLTVGIAFFLAEMGDKTQIMTMTLAADESVKIGGCGLLAKARQILPVWTGTTVGMIVADAVGVLAGVLMHKRVPTRVVKWVAAATFAVFGMIGIHESLDSVLPKGFTIHHGILLGFVPVLVFAMVYVARKSAARAARAAHETGDPRTQRNDGKS